MLMKVSFGCYGTVVPYRSRLACKTYFNSSLNLSTVCSQMALVSIQLALQHAMPHGVSCFAIEVPHVPDLRVVVDRPDLLQALFPVVAQGLLPGEQTIYRAEVAALVQVVRLAAAQPQQTFSCLGGLQQCIECRPEVVGLYSGRAIFFISR